MGDPLTRFVKKKTPEQIQFEHEFVLAAGMSGDAKTVAHIRQVLESADIRCTYEGSVIYDLFVERTKVELALELLRAERASGWRILLPEPAATGQTQNDAGKPR